jgi:predicted RNA-binding Zn-ribbon protein involved in translation (DUF1610 family)
LIECSECHREISDEAAACPHCGKPMKAPPGDPLCPTCKVQMVRTWRRTGGAVLFVTIPLALAGLIGLFVNFIGGLVVIGLAIIIDSVARGKESTLTCPKCRHESPR